MNPAPSMPVGQAKSSFGREDAARMLSLLSCPGEKVAIRSLWKPGQAEERHFTDPSAALDYLERHDGQRALYAVLNPLKPDAKPSVNDAGIACLRWFPMDADPKRPADTASTAAELAAAKSRMKEVLSFLRTHIPELSASAVPALSGNGAHCLLRLPDYSPQEAPRLKRIADALSSRFSDSAVSLDTSIYNPARIWRAYGTTNTKGDDTPDRPHRRACLLSPAGFIPVPLDLLAYEEALLTALGADAKESKKTRTKAEPHQNAGHGEEASEQPHEAPSEGAPLPPWWGEAIPSGGRNVAAHRRARWLVNATEGARFEADAWALLKAWNLTCCRPSLDTDELRRTFASACKAGDNPEYAAPKPEPFTMPAEPEWPQAAPEMFYGLAGDVVRLIEPHTEADPVALLVQFIAAFGSAIGRSAHFMAEADAHYGNLFVVVVGISSKGRKGTSWSRIRRLFALADAKWESFCLQSGLSSGEGLVWSVRDPLEKPSKNKATGEVELEIVDPGVNDKRLLIQESEYASVLRVASRDGNTLSAILGDSWDKGRLQTMTKNSAAKATDAHISLIGHVTADELRRELSGTESANGFGNRFLWICAKRSKELPEGGSLQESELFPLAGRLSGAIEAGRETGLLVRDEGARQLWRAVYHDLSAGGPGLAGAVTSRGEAQVMRLALLYALLDGAGEIEREHLTAALALWEYCEQSARYVFGDSMGDPVADDILRALRNAPEGLSRSEIRELFQRHQSSNRIGQALALLMKHNRAKVVMQVDTGGRPAERWIAVTTAEKN